MKRKINSLFFFTVVTRPRETAWPRQVRDAFLKVPNTEVIKCENESELLEELLSFMQKADPDLIIGYDCAFQFDVLMQRMFALKVSNWNRMGRLKSTTPPLLRVNIPSYLVFQLIIVRNNNKVSMSRKNWTTSDKRIMIRLCRGK